tara:strand:+ start:380 stop:652 length:273 start_codon:yes stop_codon:yes gene_type:complete
MPHLKGVLYGINHILMIKIKKKDIVMLEKLEEAWKEISTKLTSVWHDLTATELEKTQHSMEATIKFLREKYNLTEEAVISKLEDIQRNLK